MPFLNRHHIMPIIPKAHSENVHSPWALLIVRLMTATQAVAGDQLFDGLVCTGLA